MALTSTDVYNWGIKKVCKRCGKQAIMGFKCMKCEIITHYSCAALLKSVKIINDLRINCCEHDQEPHTESSSVFNSENISENNTISSKRP